MPRPSTMTINSGAGMLPMSITIVVPNTGNAETELLGTPLVPAQPEPNTV